MARTPLQYAPRLPRKWWWANRALAALAILAAIGCAVALVPHAVHRSRVLQLQRQCLSYAAPPQRVVLETAPAQYEALKATDEAFRHAGIRGQLVYAAPPWQDFYRLLSSSARWPAATLYLGQLTNPAGKSRLVCVEFLPAAPSSDNIDAHVFDLGTMLRKPRLLVTPVHVAAPDLTSERLVRVWAAQADPHNASHFTLEYETSTGKYMIDGWLRDDDSILLEQRTTPP